MKVKDLETSLIDLDRISSSVERASFPEEDLDRLARSILALGGLVRPFFVIRQDTQTFEVVQGHFEYYAAVRAAEIDDDLEMVRAYIVEPQMLPLLDQQQVIYPATPGPNHSPESQLSDPSFAATAIRSLETRLGSLEDNLLEKIKGLESALNKASKPNVRSPIDIFNTLSLPQLITVLNGAGVRGKRQQGLLEKIQHYRESKHSFSSLTELETALKGVSYKTLCKVLDAWTAIQSIG